MCSTTLAIATAALMGLGVVMVFSASASLNSPSITESPFRNPSFRQAGFTFAALVATLMVGLCPHERWAIQKGRWLQPSLALLAGTLLMLGLVLVPGIGEVRNGARRWLSLGPSSLGLGFQPSELAKLSLVVGLASICAWLGARIRRFWSGYLPGIAIVGLVAGLVGVEDFGTAVLLAVVGAAILLGAGAKIWHLGLAALPGLAAMAYLVWVKPYRLIRLTAFLDPERDPQGAGYHQVQSLISIASGKWWGCGLGAGIQKYGYLPEGRSDFIFAVVCEELGFVGAITVLGLFMVLIWQGRRAMLGASSEFGRLLALGATLMIAFQAAMNVAVVTVSVPTKGIALPFISAGGSGVLILGILVGMLINVARARPASHPVVDSAQYPAPGAPVPAFAPAAELMGPGPTPRTAAAGAG